MLPCLLNRQGDPPWRIIQAVRPGNRLRVKFCNVNVSKWGNTPSWGRIRATSNSLTEQLTGFGGGFALLKVTRWQQKATVLKGWSKSSAWRLKQVSTTSKREKKRLDTSQERHVSVVKKGTFRSGSVLSGKRGESVLSAKIWTFRYLLQSKPFSVGMELRQPTEKS